MTFIALEGVDGAGKSTVADAVEAEINKRFPGEPVTRLHSSQLERDPLDEYALDFESYVPGGGKHIIADRLHYGELIYGPLYRDESALDRAGFRWVEMYLQARGATVWHVSAALETVENRLRLRGEDYLESHHVERVWREFSSVAKTSLLHGGDAMTDEFTPDVIAEAIVAQAIWTEDRAASVFRPSYIGRHLPNVVVVGDAQQDASPGVTQAPFLPIESTSGKFLFESLPDSWWHGVGAVATDEPDLNELFEALLDPAIVALGMHASEALDDLDIDHCIVPHPEKIRRFHYKDKTQYGLMLRQTSVEGGNKLTWPK